MTHEEYRCWNIGSDTDSELYFESSQLSSGGDCPERLGSSTTSMGFSRVLSYRISVFHKHVTLLMHKAESPSILGHQSPFFMPFPGTWMKFLDCERIFCKYYLHCEFKYFLLLYNCRNWENRVWRCHVQKVPLLFNCKSLSKLVSISLPQFFNL